MERGMRYFVGSFFPFLAVFSVVSFFSTVFLAAFVLGALFAGAVFVSGVAAGTWANIAVAPRNDKPSNTVISFFIAFLLVVASTIFLVCNYHSGLHMKPRLSSN